MDAKVDALRKLEEVIETLRGPEGCPWDREQTLSDLGRYLLEEASEAADALEDSGGRPTEAVKEELGDVLMNVLLAARIAEEEGSFGISQVADGIREKLIRRHPHVFGDRSSKDGIPAGGVVGDSAPGRVRVSGVADVLANWSAIKAEEKKKGSKEPARPASRLDGVPRSLPVLERAYEIGRKAAGAGFDWPSPDGALEKVAEELGEVKALAAGGLENGRLEDELGDLLFAAVNLCRKLGVRPDGALRRTLRRFRERFEAIEERFPEMEKASLEEMEAVWQEAKSAPPRTGEAGA